MPDVFSLWWRPATTRAELRMKDLAALGVLREVKAGKEKLFIHPKLMQLLTRDSNKFVLYKS